MRKIIGLTGAGVAKLQGHLLQSGNQVLIPFDEALSGLIEVVTPQINNPDPELAVEPWYASIGVAGTTYPKSADEHETSDYEEICLSYTEADFQIEKTADPIAPVEHAAYAHVESVVAQADGHTGTSPWWHGWAVREAFEAGAEWQRSQAVIDPKWAKMDPLWVVEFLEQETRFDVALIERMLQFAIDAAQQVTKSK